MPRGWPPWPTTPVARSTPRCWRTVRRPGRREADEKLAIVERAGTHLLRLIDEVLDYSRSESRRPMLEKRPMRLADLTQHLQDSASLMVREHGNRFVLELDPALPAVVLADEQRLSQVLLNLTRNACTHTRRGTVRLRIHLVKDASAVPRVPLLHDARWHAV
ncbi:MAG: HAMP domain-containing histidine kinase, partial [Bryobacterales bacterium]|nr:HAMP domain-containing histidine kinase [Bryobacterales bacterium]